MQNIGGHCLLSGPKLQKYSRDANLCSTSLNLSVHPFWARHPKYSAWSEFYFTWSECSVAWPAKVFKGNFLSTGVPQGSVHGPLLFQTPSTYYFFSANCSSSLQTGLLGTSNHVQTVSNRPKWHLQVYIQAVLHPAAEQLIIYVACKLMLAVQFSLTNVWLVTHSTRN